MTLSWKYVERCSRAETVLQRKYVVRVRANEVVSVARWNQEEMAPSVLENRSWISGSGWPVNSESILGDMQPIKEREARWLMEQGEIKPWWNTRGQSKTGGVKHLWDGPRNDSHCLEFAERAEELTASWGWPSYTPSMGCLANYCQIVWFSWERPEMQNCMWSSLSLNVPMWFTFLKHFKVPHEYHLLSAAWSASVVSLHCPKAKEKEESKSLPMTMLGK